MSHVRRADAKAQAEAEAQDIVITEKECLELGGVHAGKLSKKAGALVNTLFASLSSSLCPRVISQTTAFSQGTVEVRACNQSSDQRTSLAGLKSCGR